MKFVILLLYLFAKVRLGENEKYSKGSVPFPEPPSDVPYINCLQCQGGPKTGCAQLSTGVDEGSPCPSNKCYEAFIGFQHGAMPIVQRRCWKPAENETEPDFCSWFEKSENKKNTNSILYACKPCTDELCNVDRDFWIYPERYPGVKVNKLIYQLLQTDNMANYYY